MLQCSTRRQPRAAIGEGERDHAADALVVDVSVGLVVDAVAAGLDSAKQRLGKVLEFKIGHGATTSVIA